MKASVLFSNNFNNICWSIHVLHAGKDSKGHLFLDLKTFDLKNALLNIIGLGKKDPQFLGLFEYFQACLKIYDFSAARIKEAAQETLRHSDPQDRNSSLLKGNIEFINKEILKDPSEKLDVPTKRCSVLGQSPAIETTSSTSPMQPDVSLESKPESFTENTSLSPPLNPSQSLQDPYIDPSYKEQETTSKTLSLSSKEEDKSHSHKTVIGLVIGVAAAVLIWIGTRGGETLPPSVVEEEAHAFPHLNDTTVPPLFNASLYNGDDFGGLSFFSRQASLVGRNLSHIEDIPGSLDIFEDHDAFTAEREAIVFSDSREVWNPHPTHHEMQMEERDHAEELDPLNLDAVSFDEASDEVESSHLDGSQQEQEVGTQKGFFYLAALTAAIGTSVICHFTRVFEGKHQARSIYGTKSQFTNRESERITSCCANAMSFFEILCKKSSDHRLEIASKDLDDAIDLGYSFHKKALKSFHGEGMQEILKITENEYRNSNPQASDKEVQTHVCTILKKLTEEMEFEGNRLDPITLLPFFSNLSFDPKVRSFGNTPLPENQKDRILHFQKVYEDLDNYLEPGQGIVGSTVTCNNQTYCIFIVQDKNRRKNYGVFDSHGVKFSEFAFAFHSTKIGEAAEKCESLSGFVEFEIDPDLKSVFEEEATQRGITNPELTNQFAIDSYKQIQNIPENQNTVGYQYLFPKN